MGVIATARDAQEVAPQAFLASLQGFLQLDDTHE